jgi:DNA polymerase-3 subunit gamma/tau
VAGLRGKVPPSTLPYLNNPNKVTGVWKDGHLTLWVDSEFTRSVLNKPPVLDGLRQSAAASFGGQPQVSIVAGKPPADSPAAPSPAPVSTGDALDELLAFGEQYDNIVIQ